MPCPSLGTMCSQHQHHVVRHYITYKEAECILCLPSSVMNYHVNENNQTLNFIRSTVYLLSHTICLDKYQLVFTVLNTISTYKCISHDLFKLQICFVLLNRFMCFIKAVCEETMVWGGDRSGDETYEAFYWKRYHCHQPAVSEVQRKGTTYLGDEIYSKHLRFCAQQRTGL